MLEREGKAFILSPEEYVREVDEVRRWFGYYGDISVVIENPNDDNMIQAKDLADMALATQEHSDSGTLEGFDVLD
jgi:hypothetical protein